MRRIGMVVLCVVAVFAISATAASAKGKPILTLFGEEGPLAEGSFFETTSPELVLSTSAGNIECSLNRLAGRITANAAKADKVQMTEDQSTGLAEGGACNTTTAYGPAFIEWRGFPWTEELTTKGTAPIKGTKKVAFAATFPDAGDVTCIFEATKVEQTFTVGAEEAPQPLSLALSGQKFKLGKGSGSACPKSGLLTESNLEPIHTTSTLKGENL